MTSYLALLRGINVGGKNLVSMPELASLLSAAGYGGVRTYIQSGNVLFATDEKPRIELERKIESLLEHTLSTPVLVVVRSHEELAATVTAAPSGHGAQDLRSDVIFLKDADSAEAAFAQLPPRREGVDSAAIGPGALYFSRVAAHASKSRLSRLVGQPIYKQMTIRNWRTTTRLLAMMDGG